MAMSDCAKCWSTPCECGHDYKEWELQRKINFVTVLQKQITATLRESIITAKSNNGVVTLPVVLEQYSPQFNAALETIDLLCKINQLPYRFLYNEGPNDYEIAIGYDINSTEFYNVDSSVVSIVLEGAINHLVRLTPLTMIEKYLKE